MFGWGPGSYFSRGLSYWIRLFQKYFKGLLHEVLDFPVRVFMPHSVLENPVHFYQLVIATKNELGSVRREGLR